MRAMVSALCAGGRAATQLTEIMWSTIRSGSAGWVHVTLTSRTSRQWPVALTASCHGGPSKWGCSGRRAAINVPISCAHDAPPIGHRRDHGQPTAWHEHATYLLERLAAIEPVEGVGDRDRL